MNIKSNKWKKASRPEILAILLNITPKDHELPKPHQILELTEMANKNLQNSEFKYFTKKEAIKKFGKKAKGYIKPNGLPCITNPLFSGTVYMHSILVEQFRMHEELLNGLLIPSISNLSKYIFYSISAHNLSQLGWET